VFGLIPRQWRLGILALAAAVLVLPASSAMADGGATATNPSFTFTFKAKHGWHITVLGYICGSKYAGVSVNAMKAGKHYSLSHYYSGALKKSGCTGSTTLKSGKIHAHWGNLFYLKMRVKGAGALTTIPTPKGCTGTLGHQRPIKGHGTLRLRIHKGVLGSITKTKLKGVAQLDNSSKNFKCTGQVPKETFGNGAFGSNNLFASKDDKTNATTLSVFGIDKAGSHVYGNFTDTFFGEEFNFSKDLTSATIGSITGFMSGSVSFSGTKNPGAPGCVNGSWSSGTLKVHDGISKVTLVGSSQATGSVNKSNASCYG
jgi:hypothetical protein